MKTYLFSIFLVLGVLLSNAQENPNSIGLCPTKKGTNYCNFLDSIITKSKEAKNKAKENRDKNIYKKSIDSLKSLQEQIKTIDNTNYQRVIDLCKFLKEQKGKTSIISSVSIKVKNKNIPIQEVIKNIEATVKTNKDILFSSKETEQNNDKEKDTIPLQDVNTKKISTSPGNKAELNNKIKQLVAENETFKNSIAKLKKNEGDEKSWLVKIKDILFYPFTLFSLLFFGLIKNKKIIFDKKTDDRSGTTINPTTECSENNNEGIVEHGTKRVDNKGESTLPQNFSGSNGGGQTTITDEQIKDSKIYKELLRTNEDLNKQINILEKASGQEKEQVPIQEEIIIQEEEVLPIQEEEKAIYYYHNDLEKDGSLKKSKSSTNELGWHRYVIKELSDNITIEIIQKQEYIDILVGKKMRLLDPLFESKPSDVTSKNIIKTIKPAQLKYSDDGKYWLLKEKGLIEFNRVD